MQINTPRTVQKTLEKYRWNDLENWQETGDGNFQRPVYQKGEISILQKKWPEGQGIEVETPDYTMYVGMGYHLNVFEGHSATKYYSLSVAATRSEKKLYQSMMDEAGYKSIQGDRQHLLRFKESLPEKYFSLEVDEKAHYVASFWMRIPRRAAKFKRLIKEKE